MQRFILLVFVLFLSFSLSANADSWDDFADVDKAWDGQKAITNKEFEEVMDALQVNEKKKEEKQEKKFLKKFIGGGTSLHSDMNHQKEIPTMKSLKSDDGILINIPVNIVVDGKFLEKGYYKVFAEKDENKKVYLSLYQSQYFKGKFEATETNDDFGEETVDFAKVLQFNESFVKIIYGSIDLNAYAFIPYVE